MRPRTAHAPLLLLVSLSLAGCARGWRVDGTLVDAEGKPVSGATVQFRCGPRSAPTGPMYTMASNDLGAFAAHGASLADDPGASCSLEILASGHPTRTVAVTDTCYRSSGTGNLGEACAAGEGKILVP